MFNEYFGSKLASKNIDEIRKYTKSPMGLYLYGGVGCGKTMLMDLFYETDVSPKKERVHFHKFMLDIHKRKNFIGLYEIWSKIRNLEGVG